MKKTLSSAFAFVGTVIGAGFATGKEISLYFSSCSPLSVLLSGGFLGFFCYVILRLSAKHGSIFSSFGKLQTPVRIFVALSNFCVLCATVAGGEIVLNDLFSLPGGAVFLAFLTLGIVLIGTNYVKLVNAILVPVIIALVLLVAFRNGRTSFSGKTSIVLPFAYASMNIISGGFFLGENAKSFTKKQAALCSLIAGSVLSLLLLCIYLCVKNVSAEMPFLEKADALGFGKAGSVVLLFAMLTTSVGTLSVCIGKRKDLAFPIVVAALLASLFGFETFVNTFYPVMGAIGGALTVFMVIRWVYSSFFLAKKSAFSFSEKRNGLP